MADEIITEEFEDEEIYTLTDEDGVERQFSLLGQCDVEGKTYLALVPLEDNDEGEYVILRLELDENGDDMLVTIDDDDEFDRISDIFEDGLFGEIDYDPENK